MKAVLRNMMRRSILLLVVFMLIRLVGFAQNPVDHGLFDDVLKKYVNEKGWVDYAGLKKDRVKFDQYLSLLRNNHPKDSWSRNEQVAYWINAYNAFTLELILKHYPLDGIKDIGSMIQIPFVNTPWDIKFIEIEGKEYDLNNIEHDFLRDKFEESRIHFAVVCASYSCPRLFRDAFFPETLNEQLNAAAINFINDPRKNKVGKSEVGLSKLFSWYGGDFKKKTSLIEYLNQYSKVKIADDADISFLDYDWSLNDQLKQE